MSPVIMVDRKREGRYRGKGGGIRGNVTDQTSYEFVGEAELGKKKVVKYQRRFLRNSYRMIIVGG